MNDSTTLIEAVAALQRADVPVLWDWSVSADPANPLVYALSIQQGGLTLPSPSYYTSTSGPKRVHRSAYANVVTGVLKLLGMSQPDALRSAQLVRPGVYARELPDDGWRGTLTPL